MWQARHVAVALLTVPACAGKNSSSFFAASCFIRAPTRRSSSARPGPWRGMSSSIVLRIKHATGFKSLANASQPNRSASSGIDAPPAKGSTTSGGSSQCAAFTNPREASRYSLFEDSSQLAKSPINFNNALRRSSSLTRAASFLVSPGMSPSNSRASALNSGGQYSSQGSGSNRANSNARHAASGLRAHQRWSVEGCPCRIDVSWPGA